MTEHVQNLKAAQAKFEKVYKERLAEQAGKTLSQAKALRVELTELYEFLVDFTAINAYAYPVKATLLACATSSMLSAAATKNANPQRKQNPSRKKPASK